MKKGTLLYRFNEKYKINPETNCWEWTAFLDEKGYGKISNYNKTYFAHRISYTLFKGEIPKNILVLHKCDNPCCVNPDHLFLGTQQDNVDDMIAKGRSVKGRHFNCKKGEFSYLSKLNEKKVIQIINLLKTNNSVTSIAHKFNISRGAITAIKFNRSWKHIPRN